MQFKSLSIILIVLKVLFKDFKQISRIQCNESNRILIRFNILYFLKIAKNSRQFQAN